MNKNEIIEFVEIMEEIQEKDMELFNSLAVVLSRMSKAQEKKEGALND